MSKPNPMGSTFAERKAAAEGKSSFDAPEIDQVDAAENTTFADRGKKVGGKAVDGDGAENKAVAKKSASNKS